MTKAGFFAVEPMQQQGFTLLELMVTVSIVAILAGIGFPSFRDLIAAQRVRSATSAVYDALIIARSEAVKRNTDAQFVYGGVSLATGWTITAAGETVHSQDSLSAVTFNPAAPGFSFSNVGRLTAGANTAITITATGTTSARCLRVDLNGRPSVNPGEC